MKRAAEAEKKRAIITETVFNCSEALARTCIFHQIARNSLEIRQDSRLDFARSDEKSDSAIYAPDEIRASLGNTARFRHAECTVGNFVRPVKSRRQSMDCRGFFGNMMESQQTRCVPGIGR